MLANFRELRKAEVQLRRIPLLRTRVNKGMNWVAPTEETGDPEQMRPLWGGPHSAPLLTEGAPMGPPL